MLPRLGGKYQVEVVVVSKPREAFRCEEYYALELPVAPAVMVGEEIVVEGRDVDEATLEAAIRRHLGLTADTGEKKE
jgi:hypothetical protein